MSKTPSTDKLVAALAEMTASPARDALIEQAKRHDFHEYLSRVHDLPITALVEALRRVGTLEASSLINRAIAGEFDASKQEGDDWAASPEGQAAFAELTRKA